MYPDNKSVHSVLFQALRASLSLTEEEANQHLIRAYADIPMAEPPPDRNLCYFYLKTDQAIVPLQERSTEASSALTFSFFPCRIFLTFYGPDCEAWTHRCRTWLFLDGKDKPLSILRAAGIYPIPSPLPPSVFHEEIGKTYRKRADLVIRARLADESVYASAITEQRIEIETIATPPAVRVHLSECD